MTKRKSDPDKHVSWRNAPAVAHRVMIAGWNTLSQSDFNNAADLAVHLGTATATAATLLWLRRAWEES
jgi:hypothetical protein